MKYSDRSENGLSIFELLVVLFIISLMSATVVSNIKEINRPLTDASFEITHFLRLSRSRAISQTLYMKVSPLSLYKLVVASGSSCAAATTTVNDLSLTLPNDTSLTSTSWSVCFTPRGLVNETVSFDIIDEESHRKTVQIALGGGVQIP